MTDEIKIKKFNPLKYIELNPELKIAKGNMSEEINERFEINFKRPHQLLDKDNKVKFDGRFKLFKKKDIHEDISVLHETIKKFLKDNPSAREMGTDSLTNIYKKETPGE